MPLLPALLAMAILSESSGPPPPPREFRGAWIATVDNIDWPSEPGLPVEVKREELRRTLDLLHRLNFNAVVFQVRPHGDAMYPSPYEPWSWYLTGVQGRAPGEGWDPLAFVVEEGHRRGFEVHAWFNPYRATHPAQKGPYAESHVSRTNPEVVRPYGRFGWMDPGSKFVQDRAFNVMMDVLARYDIDAVHMDDYFYPYPVTQDGERVPFPDDGTYRAYRTAGGSLPRDDWRRKNVDDFVRRVRGGIQARKPWVRFGISPFGIYRPGVPTGIRAGIDQYADLSSDARTWLREGLVDYLAPQLYWRIDPPAQSFPRLLEWWASQNVKRRHLWPGLYTSRLNPATGNWPAEEILRQLSLAEPERGATGTIHFSTVALAMDWGGIAKALAGGPYARPALPPATPWLGHNDPPAVRVERSVRGVDQAGDGEWVVAWTTSRDGDAAKMFATWSKIGAAWRFEGLSSERTARFGGRAGQLPDAFAVAAFTRTGALGRPLVVPRPALANR